MRRHLRPFKRAILMFCFSNGLQAQRHQPAFRQEFYCEKEVSPPAVLPEPLVSVFSHDQLVREALKEAKVQPGIVPAGWYQATMVHLSVRQEIDYLVIGRFPLGGAHASALWIYRPSGTGWKAAFLGGGDRIAILRSSTRGLFDIETDYFAVDAEATIYRFDGNTYKLRDTKRIR